MTTITTPIIAGQLTYTGDGSTTVFAIPVFDRDSDQTLYVTVNGVQKTLGTDFTIQQRTEQINAFVGDTLTFLSAPVLSASILIGVQTPQRDQVISDDNLPRKDQQAFTGNGVQKTFAVGLVNAPSAMHFIASVGGVQKTYGVDYTLDAALENLTFAVAPGNGVAILVWAYQATIYNGGVFPDPFRPAVLDAAANIADPFTGFTPVVNDPATSAAETNHIIAQAAPLGKATFTLAKDSVSFTGDGIKKAFTLPFAAMSWETFTVTVNGVSKVKGTDYTFTVPSTITFVVTPPAGQAVVITRGTPVVNADDISHNEPAFTTVVTRTNS